MAEAPRWGFGQLSPETRWVLGHGLPTNLRPPEEPLDDRRWEELTHQCRGHRLEGHLIASVTSGELPTTAAQRHEVARLEVDLTRTRIVYDEVCRPVLQALDQADVPVRLIKGSALPWSDYPDPQLRPTADLDILVPGPSLARAAEVLTDLGGRPVNPEPSPGFSRHVFKGLTVTMPSGLEVDMHRILSWGPFGVRVPEADLWAPGRKFDRLGTPAVTLDVDRTLIHMCAHLLILGAIRASEVRDVAQLATSPELCPDRTLQIARRWGHESLLATGLVMAERELRLVSDAQPLSRWAAGHRPSLRDRTWMRIDQPNAPIAGAEPVGVFCELGGFRARAIFTRAIVAPRSGTDPTLFARLRRLAARFGHRHLQREKSR